MDKTGDMSSDGSSIYRNGAKNYGSISATTDSDLDPASNDMIRRLQHQTREVVNILRDDIDKLGEGGHQTPEVENILRDDIEKLTEREQSPGELMKSAERFQQIVREQRVLAERRKRRKRRLVCGIVSVITVLLGILIFVLLAALKVI